MNNQLKTLGIIQARIGSSRLPNKMILSLRGYPIIDWVIQRCIMSKNLDDILIAIPDTVENDILDYHITQQGYKVFRGSENNVLSRFYFASTKFKADLIVRICGDNPYICASEIDRVVDLIKDTKCDYAYNHIPFNNSYPDGLGAEVVNIKTLDYINKKAKAPHLREHIFNYIWENKNHFSIMTCDPASSFIKHPNLRFDVDSMDDFLYLTKLDVSMTSNASDIVASALSQISS